MVGSTGDTARSLTFFISLVINSGLGKSTHIAMAYECLMLSVSVTWSTMANALLRVAWW
jgi:hypothetical protein